MKKTNNEIIKNVIENGRLYPRPSDKCDICNEDIILCWGNIVTSYWRHLINTHHDHSPNTESFNHKFAKNILTKYLNNKNRCSFIHICDDTIINIPKNVIIFQLEVPYNNCRFDIGGFDKDNNLIFGIEIYYTHKTTNTKSRNDIEWVEIKANDVIDNLDRENISNDIIITDHSEKECCHKRFIEKLSLLQIATNLNYLTKNNPYNKEITKLLIALNGFYYVKIMWYLYGNSCECNNSYCDTCNNLKNKQHANELWAEFLSRKQCLSCGQDHHTTQQKPFCYGCYIKIKNGKKDKLIKIRMPNKDKEYTKKKLIEINDKIKNNTYDFIGDNKFTCDGDGKCLLLSLDDKEEIVVSKNPYCTCIYDCTLCKNFFKEWYDILPKNCYNILPSDVLIIGGGFCINCATDEYRKKEKEQERRIQDQQKIRALELEYELQRQKKSEEEKNRKEEIILQKKLEYYKNKSILNDHELNEKMEILKEKKQLETENSNKQKQYTKNLLVEFNKGSYVFTNINDDKIIFDHLKSKNIDYIKKIINKYNNNNDILVKITHILEKKEYELKILNVIMDFENSNYKWDKNDEKILDDHLKKQSIRYIKLKIEFYKNKDDIVNKLKCVLNCRT